VDTLLGDASKARAILGWRPEVGFDELVAEMMAADRQIARRDALNRHHGFQVAAFRE